MIIGAACSSGAEQWIETGMFLAVITMEEIALPLAAAVEFP